MSRLSKAHIWVGFTLKSQSEFDKYFDQSNAYLFSPSGKEKDPSQLELDELLENMEDISSLQMVKEACMKKKVTKANAFFFYTDSSLQIKDPNKKYNDLTYIGSFDTDF
jgi:hypothetical protein